MRLEENILDSEPRERFHLKEGASSSPIGGINSTRFRKCPTFSALCKSSHHGFNLPIPEYISEKWLEIQSLEKSMPSAPKIEDELISAGRKKATESAAAIIHPIAENPTSSLFNYAKSKGLKRTRKGMLRNKSRNWIQFIGFLSTSRPRLTRSTIFPTRLFYNFVFTARTVLIWISKCIHWSVSTLDWVF